MQPAWRHTLQIEWPTRLARCRAERVRETEGFTAATLRIDPLEGDESILASYWAPPGILTNPAPRVVVICNGRTDAPLPDAAAKPAGLPLALLQHGLAVGRGGRGTSRH